MGELSGYKVRWIWRLWEKEVEEYALCRLERRAGKTTAFDPQSAGYLFYFGGFPGYDLQGNSRQKTGRLQSRRRMEYPQKRLPRLHGKELNTLGQLSLF